jgi:hypothetical protein
MTVTKKEDFDKTADVNGSGISLDHPDTADMSLNPTNRQVGNIQRKVYFREVKKGIV